MELIKRMLKELDEFIHGGLKNHIIKKTIEVYSAITICVLFAYLIDHWILKQVAVYMLLIPIIVVIIAFPAWWYFDIKPITDKKEMQEMFEYRCVYFSDKSKSFWINSNVQLNRSDLFIVNDKKYFVESFEEGFILIKPVGNIIAVWKA